VRNYCLDFAYTAFMSARSTSNLGLSRAQQERAKWLNEREMRAWRGYIDTIAELETALEADLVELGLSVGDYQVLVYLSESDDRQMRMCDLAEQLHLSPSGLTRRLDGLVSMGAVGREQSPEDRRVTLAVLTPQGWELLQRIAPEHVHSVRRHFIDLLTPEQLDVMGDVFDVLRGHLHTLKRT
jgi:DNA-binding MarR family transcriptional regulator